jgi:anti-anti-sigma factor
MPDRTPALWDVEQVVEGVMKRGSARRVVFNLAHLTYISSSLVSRLVVMNRRVRAVGSDFVLCGMSAVVRESFDTFQLVKAFTIVETEEEAVRS